MTKQGSVIETVLAVSFFAFIQLADWKGAAVLAGGIVLAGAWLLVTTFFSVTTRRQQRGFFVTLTVLLFAAAAVSVPHFSLARTTFVEELRKQGGESDTAESLQDERRADLPVERAIRAFAEQHAVEHNDPRRAAPAVQKFEEISDPYRENVTRAAMNARKYLQTLQSNRLRPRTDTWLPGWGNRSVAEVHKIVHLASRYDGSDDSDHGRRDRAFAGGPNRGEGDPEDQQEPSATIRMNGFVPDINSGIRLSKHDEGVLAGVTVSIILPTKYEEDYVARTLRFIYETTPLPLLLECIVVDDLSPVPILPLLHEAVHNQTHGELAFLTYAQRKSIVVLRMETHQGLIRAKIAGAERARGTHLVFLDAHCQPYDNWLQPLVKRSILGWSHNHTASFTGGKRVDLARKKSWHYAKRAPAEAAASTSGLLLHEDGREKKAKVVAHEQESFGGNYKRIVVPLVGDVNASEPIAPWIPIGDAGGSKMMFEWNFEFDWFDDDNDLVPVLSGGLLLMTKRWWNEVGGYDDGMADWGGENIEQSLRCWICGGEIVVERDSLVGHVFSRPENPEKVRTPTVQRNKARAAYVWLDAHYHVDFAREQQHVREKDFELGRNLLRRLLFRHAYGTATGFSADSKSSEKCQNFDWFDKFYEVFETQGLVMSAAHHLRHTASGLCLTAQDNGKTELATVHLRECAPDEGTQKWSVITNGTRIVSHKLKKCLDRGNDASRKTPILYSCDYAASNPNQIWTLGPPREPRADWPPPQGTRVRAGNYAGSVVSDLDARNDGGRVTTWSALKCLTWSVAAREEDREREVRTLANVYPVPRFLHAPPSATIVGDVEPREGSSTSAVSMKAGGEEADNNVFEDAVGMRDCPTSTSSPHNATGSGTIRPSFGNEEDGFTFDVLW